MEGEHIFGSARGGQGLVQARQVLYWVFSRCKVDYFLDTVLDEDGNIEQVFILRLHVQNILDILKHLFSKYKIPK